MITSDDLQIIQKILENQIKVEIDKPDTDHKDLIDLVLLTEKVDKHRRDLWHKEHFGVYEDMVDNLNHIDRKDVIEEDDIPF